jgi:hypothetical protein
MFRLLFCAVNERATKESDELRAVREINEAPAAGDTFFGFQAPAGQFILRLTITNTSGNWIYLDDFAFVIEPFVFFAACPRKRASAANLADELRTVRAPIFVRYAPS